MEVLPSTTPSIKVGAACSSARLEPTVPIPRMEMFWSCMRTSSSTDGENSARSSRVRKPCSTSSEPAMASREMGTSCKDCSRRCAVTMISSRAWPYTSPGLVNRMEVMIEEQIKDNLVLLRLRFSIINPLFLNI